MKRSLAFLAGVAVLAALAAGGCAPKAEKAEAPKAKVFRFSYTSDIPTLDPQMGNSMMSATISFHVFDGLTRMDNGAVKPGIAESWSVSPDGIVYTFKLRDAKWSDGKPIKASEFEYGMRRLMDPAAASPYSFLGLLLENAEAVNAGKAPVDSLGVKAIDDKTLEVRLAYPADYFLGMLSMSQFCATRPELVAQHGKDFAASPEKNVYSGPFMVKSWVREDRMVLVKNPNYWNKGVIKLDEIQVLVVPDENTALAMFDAGDLDLVRVPPAYVEKYKDRVVYYYDGSNDFIKLNMAGTGPLSNRDFRLALNYAIDRQDFVDITTKGLYDANPRYVLPQVAGVEKDYGTEYPYAGFGVKADPAKAKEYLSNALRDLKITDPSSITIEFLTSDTDRARAQAEIIQDQWQKNLGIKVNVKQGPYRQRLDMETKKLFQTVFSGWAPDYSDPMTYLELWTSDSPYNHGSYRSAKYDELIAFARKSTDKRARMDAMFNAEKELLADGAIVPMQLRRESLLINTAFSGVSTYFIGTNYDLVHVDKVGM